jgi:hypothetical protein
MINIIKVNLKMIKYMGRVNLLILMDKLYKDFGKRIYLYINFDFYFNNILFFFFNKFLNMNKFK